MGSFSASLPGLKELDQKLNALKGKTANRLIHDAVMEGGKVLQAEERMRAPVRATGQHGNALPPGALRADIELVFGITEERLPAAIIKPGKYTKHVARWLEYGHRLVRGGYSKVMPNGRVRGPGRASSTGVQPYPFIRPAFETARTPATMAAVASLQRNLPAAVKTGTVTGSPVAGGME
jgi:Bacteriophage HK97-gp10, putative tail-component